jgi:hypothetical protein
MVIAKIPKPELSLRPNRQQRLERLFLRLHSLRLFPTHSQLSRNLQLPNLRLPLRPV